MPSLDLWRLPISMLKVFPREQFDPWTHYICNRLDPSSMLFSMYCATTSITNWTHAACCSVCTGPLHP
jgi:hypothetical protein